LSIAKRAVERSQGREGVVYLLTDANLPLGARVNRI